MIRDQSETEIAAPSDGLPTIPVISTGPDFPRETLKAAEPTAHALLDVATRGVPQSVLKALDRTSRRWLKRSNNPALPEIDGIARQLDRPGIYFLSVNYEWGCTTAVKPSPDGQGAVITRVPDWRTPGLGRHVIAADVEGRSGPFTTLTWPGYTGILQATAPGRFAGALNQAPMRRGGGGLYPVDWFANRIRVWRSKHDTPGHLLRHAFETAETFADARDLLANTPISTPAIFALVGLKPHELTIIERTETSARVLDGPRSTANMWQSPGWGGRPRGAQNAERICQLAALTPDVTSVPAAWLRPPVLNPTTRLAVVANPATGALAAQGFEAEQPATAALIR